MVHVSRLLLALASFVFSGVPIACDSISTQGCQSSTCAPWLQLESTENNIFHPSMAAGTDLSQSVFLRPMHTHKLDCLSEFFVAIKQPNLPKTLCLCDKSVAQSQSSHSHTAYTNVDSSTNTNNNAEQEHPCAKPRRAGADILQDEPLGLIEAKCAATNWLILQTCSVVPV